jgi:hypothetical protein
VAEVGGRVAGYEWFCNRDVHEETAWAIASPSRQVSSTPTTPLSTLVSEQRDLAAIQGISGQPDDRIAVRRGADVRRLGNWSSLRTHLRFGFSPEKKCWP